MDNADEQHIDAELERIIKGEPGYGYDDNEDDDTWKIWGYSSQYNRL